ncbi:MAG TPA: energy transducer TonB [Candidatus Acidoferrales bacterium]|jgi:protein TonB|nr:energy transducer TonB [Candidatus Acidoferrales bacterium]
MRRPTLLQISFGISILCHVALFGLYEIYESGLRNVTAQPENNSDNPVALTIVAAPEEPQPPAPIPRSAPLPKPPAPKPVKAPLLVQQPPLKHSEPAAALSTPPPISVIVQPKSTPPAPPAIDISDTPEKTETPAPPAISTQPDYLKNPAPVYPAAARRRHEEGLVILTVNVTADGHAAKVSIKKSSGFKLLDDAAAEAVENWEFEPARLGPVSLESDVEVPIRFELTQP